MMPPAISQPNPETVPLALFDWLSARFLKYVNVFCRPPSPQLSPPQGGEGVLPCFLLSPLPQWGRVG